MLLSNSVHILKHTVGSPPSPGNFHLTIIYKVFPSIYTFFKEYLIIIKYIKISLAYIHGACLKPLLHQTTEAMPKPATGSSQSAYSKKKKWGQCLKKVENSCCKSFCTTKIYGKKGFVGQRKDVAKKRVNRINEGEDVAV